MSLRKLIIALILFPVILSTGCKSSGTKPSNPFAQNRQTVPPPATFSSQESYLGQTPGTYVPQTPAATFPSSGSIPPTGQPTPIPANAPLPGVTAPAGGFGMTNEQPAAALFTSAQKEKENVWTPVEVVSTSMTAFQAMETKVNSASFNDNGTQKTSVGSPESLIVGTSHVVTTISEESQPNSTLAEPQLLYSGKYAE